MSAEKAESDAPRFAIGICHICGDNGANYHYNGYACQWVHFPLSCHSFSLFFRSCRVFFTRSLLRGKPFTCQNRNRCVITKGSSELCYFPFFLCFAATRTDCPACRFQKCLKANMASNGMWEKSRWKMEEIRWIIEVGRYKRQGGAVVPYRLMLNTEIVSLI